MVVGKPESYRTIYSHIPGTWYKRPPKSIEYTQDTVVPLELLTDIAAIPSVSRAATRLKI